MKMPSRSQYADGQEFLAALDQWMGASEAAYQNLRALYDATEPSFETADWVKQPTGINIRHIMTTDGSLKEGDLEPALRNLSGSIFHSGHRPVRLCHGVFNKSGEYWGCYAEIEPA